jgi:hypothetical protein
MHRAQSRLQGRHLVQKRMRFGRNRRERMGERLGFFAPASRTVGHTELFAAYRGLPDPCMELHELICGRLLKSGQAATAGSIASAWA